MVVLIIGVLLAIAIPTFLGARHRAEDRSAQSSLRNAMSAAQVIYTDQASYAQVTNLTLAAAEPSLTYGLNATAVSTGPRVIGHATTLPTNWGGAVLSKSGKCFLIRINTAAVGNQIFYGSQTVGSCNGTAALGATVVGTNW